METNEKKNKAGMMDDELSKEIIMFLLNNRLGATPVAMTYIIDNRMIERCIRDYVLRNTKGAKPFAIETSWNRRYNPRRDDNKGANENPFNTRIICKFSKNDIKKNGTNDVYNKVYNRIINNVDSNKVRQIYAMESNVMNKVVGSLTADGKVNWKIHNKKKSQFYCDLDFDAVLDYCMIATMGRHSAEFDINDVKPTKGDEFTMYFSKKIKKDDFRRSNRDEFGIHRH
jgi:hypothetical protein